MNEQTIDLKKDHCVIYRDSDGRFCRFQWIPNEKHPLEEVKAKIAEWNEQAAKQPELCNTTELVTDGLIKDICAYAYKKLQEKDKEKSDESGKEEARRKIERALELLEDAKDCLE